MDGFSLQDPGHPHHILIAGVGAGADEHLIHLQGARLLHGDHVVRHMGPGHQGHQGVQVDVDDLVIGRVRVRRQGGEILLPALGPQEGPGHLVAGENGGGGSQLRPHVGDGGPLRHRQGAHALADVFHHPAHAALDAQPAQHLQDDVLGGHGVGQPARQPDAHHLRAGEIVGAAAHGHGHVQPAGADGQHADAAPGGRMAVGAQQRHAGHAEALQVHLVADAVAGLGAVDAVLAGHGLDILMIVRVLKAGLQGVVVDIRHALPGFDPADAHGLKLQVAHGARGVLGQGLVDPDGYFLPRVQPAAEQMGAENFLSQVHEVPPMEKMPLWDRHAVL